jgi:hypothetical protein
MPTGNGSSRLTLDEAIKGRHLLCVENRCERLFAVLFDINAYMFQVLYQSVNPL